jgi:hypothetical protein
MRPQLAIIDARQAKMKMEAGKDENTRHQHQNYSQMEDQEAMY